MSTCLECGQDIPRSSQWNGLHISESGQVSWQGMKVQVSPTQAKMLFVLARRGEATRFSLEMTSKSDGGKVVDVQICNLRKKLRAAGIPVRIQNIHGFGYRLELIEP